MIQFKLLITIKKNSFFSLKLVEIHTIKKLKLMNSYFLDWLDMGKDQIFVLPDVDADNGEDQIYVLPDVDAGRHWPRSICHCKGWNWRKQKNMTEAKEGAKYEIEVIW